MERANTPLKVDKLNYMVPAHLAAEIKRMLVGYTDAAKTDAQIEAEKKPAPAEVAKKTKPKTKPKTKWPNK